MRFLLVLFLTACASKTPVGSSGAPAGAIDGDLRVSSTSAGHLRAKLTLKNTTDREISLTDLGPAAFRVETTDGKPMPFKGARSTMAPVKLGPGQSTEAAFNLQDNYPFWDRRTKYKIWFESGALKSNVVQVWF